MMLFTLALMAVCCSEEDLSTPSAPSKNGEEVKFGLSLEKSRTIYGPENTTDNNFPIYWSDGDKVLVASPQCSRQSAEYSITPVSRQSYAEAITRVGDYGVQWGNTPTADFYSIYPAAGASWITLTESDVTAKLNIASTQSANIVYDETNKIYSAADMNNVVMYARTAAVENGKTVDLQYIPYSTMLEFELRLAQNTDEQGNLSDWGTVKIVSMTLTAPTNTAIAGDFTLQFNGTDAPVISASGNNNNIIKLNFETQQVLSKDNQVLKAKLALIPISGVTSLSDWNVAVEVLEGTDTQTKTYTKTLNISKPLIPGDIHKIKLPTFTSKTAWVPDMTKWITQLEDYQNIYLTELSLPGAWYGLGKDDGTYQAEGHTATSLWNAGVRAFAVECRTSSEFKLLSNANPEAVVVSGTGSPHDINQSYYGGTKLRTVIKSLADKAAASLVYDENKNVIGGEFAVLVLSYADGGNGGHRPADYAYFINGIKSEMTNSGVSNFATNIDANTTVKNVLGKLIIKINVDKNLTKSSYNNDMNAAISYNPFLQQLTPEEGQEDVDYTVPLFSKMYWKTWDDGYKTYSTTSNKTDFWWCFSSANRTQVNTGTNATIPTYAQRQTALRTMINHSKEISDAGTHNVWFYFNSGGTQTTSSTNTSTDAKTFASTMNAFLYDVVKLKANGGVDTEGYYTGKKGSVVASNPSPLGIVMFNQCTGANDTYHGADIIKEIVEMNNKFKLKRYSGDSDSEFVPGEEEEDPFA